LLREYVERRSEAAFAELVRRHVDLVYSAAVRMVHDTHLAEDVTQRVFIALVQNARPLTERSVLSGWLHRTTQNLAANAVRSEVRRHAREKEAATMNELLASEPGADWQQIAPHLDEALGDLSDSDRDAICLRYFERKSAREMAQILSTSEEAAQKRVNRAVERLRDFFSKRSITVGASLLVVVISEKAVQAAPVGLGVTISASGALAGTALAGSATAAAAKTLTMTTLQKLLIVTGIAAATVTGFLVQRQSQVRLRESNQFLRQQIAQLQKDNERLSGRISRSKIASALNLPAPPVRIAPAPAGSVPDFRSRDLIARMQFGERAPTLTWEQAESYLKENHRSAASLLAAFRATGDSKLLAEAAEKYPNDPQVAFTAAYQPGVSAADQRHWLDVFQQSAPENALPNYLSALNHFKAGQTDQAIKDLTSAAARQNLQDYSWDFIQNGEEAYRAAGYPEVEARVIPSMALVLPHLAELKQLNNAMIELATAYRQAGDDASAQAALQMNAALGQRLSGPGNPALITQLVGMTIEGLSLKEMDPNGPYGNGGQTVKDRLDEISQRKSTLTEFAKQLDGIYATISAPDWISYHDRWHAFGEDNAIKWLLNKYGQK
jgi:RNA polymerase sigma factor (sigma-70 family)